MIVRSFCDVSLPFGRNILLCFHKTNGAFARSYDRGTFTHFKEGEGEREKHSVMSRNDRTIAHRAVGENL